MGDYIEQRFEERLELRKVWEGRCSMSPSGRVGVDDRPLVLRCAATVSDSYDGQFNEREQEDNQAEGG